MTTACPDWAALAREREHAEQGPEIGATAIDRAWADALRHREDCAHCRAVSLQVDPLLLMSGAFAGVHDRADTAREVDELRRRVRLELDGRATERRLRAARTARRRVPVASVLAAGAAAAAFGLGFLLWPETTPSPGDVVDSELSLSPHIAMAPLVEPLGDEPMGVFQFPGNGIDSKLDMVLVVTEIAP
ncbi:MAG: hypothetical protein OXG74_14015 [Acidobacteria bacterium]|nr:hypothetical protein [Acidobacteriota bacterium]